MPLMQGREANSVSVEGKQSQSFLLFNSYGNFVFGSFENYTSSITWFRKSLDSGTPFLKFLPNLCVVNTMSSVAKQWINQLR